MMPDTKIKAIKRINDYLENLTEMDETLSARILINDFEKECPEERLIIYDWRNYLCDRTFEIYKEKYPIGTC